MRAIVLGFFALSCASLLPGLAAAEPSSFPLEGIWAVGQGSCSDAKSFVQFDGRDVIGRGAKVDQARVGADYAAAFDAGRVTLDVTDARSQARNHLVFLVEDANAMRLESSLVPVKLTRCPAAAQHVASQP